MPVGISPQVTDGWAASSFVDEHPARMSAGAMANAAARRRGLVCGGRRIQVKGRSIRSRLKDERVHHVYRPESMRIGQSSTSTPYRVAKPARSSS